MDEFPSRNRSQPLYLWAPPDGQGEGEDLGANSSNPGLPNKLDLSFLNDTETPNDAASHSDDNFPRYTPLRNKPPFSLSSLSQQPPAPGAQVTASESEKLLENLRFGHPDNGTTEQRADQPRLPSAPISLSRNLRTGGRFRLEESEEQDSEKRRKKPLSSLTQDTSTSKKSEKAERTSIKAENRRSVPPSGPVTHRRRGVGQQDRGAPSVAPLKENQKPRQKQVSSIASNSSPKAGMRRQPLLTSGSDAADTKDGTVLSIDTKNPYSTLDADDLSSSSDETVQEDSFESSLASASTNAKVTMTTTVPGSELTPVETPTMTQEDDMSDFAYLNLLPAEDGANPDDDNIHIMQTETARSGGVDKPKKKRRSKQKKKSQKTKVSDTTNASAAGPESTTNRSANHPSATKPSRSTDDTVSEDQPWRNPYRGSLDEIMGAEITGQFTASDRNTIREMYGVLGRKGRHAKLTTAESIRLTRKQATLSPFASREVFEKSQEFFRQGLLNEQTVQADSVPLSFWNMSQLADSLPERREQEAVKAMADLHLGSNGDHPDPNWDKQRFMDIAHTLTDETLSKVSAALTAKEPFNPRVASEGTSGTQHHNRHSSGSAPAQRSFTYIPRVPSST